MDSNSVLRVLVLNGSIKSQNNVESYRGLLENKPHLILTQPSKSGKRTLSEFNFLYMSPCSQLLNYLIDRLAQQDKSLLARKLRGRRGKVASLDRMIFPYPSRRQRRRIISHIHSLACRKSSPDDIAVMFVDEQSLLFARWLTVTLGARFSGDLSLLARLSTGDHI